MSDTGDYTNLPETESQAEEAAELLLVENPGDDANKEDAAEEKADGEKGDVAEEKADEEKADEEKADEEKADEEKADEEKAGQEKVEEKHDEGDEGDDKKVMEEGDEVKEDDDAKEPEQIAARLYEEIKTDEEPSWNDLSAELKEKHTISYAIFNVWENRNKKCKANNEEAYNRATIGSTILVEEFLNSCSQYILFKDIEKQKKDVIEKRMHPKSKEDEEKRERKSRAVEKLEISEQFTYDYAIIFRLLKKKEDNDEERMEELEQVTKILNYLRYAELKLLTYKAEVVPGMEDEDRLICLLGAAEDRLRKEADRLQFDLLLDHDKIQELGLKMTPPFILSKQVANTDEYKEFTIDLFKGTYGIYKNFKVDEKGCEDEKSSLYIKYNDTPYRPDSRFSELARLKLTKSIVEADSHPEIGGASLTLAAYARNPKHPAIGFFALHEPADRFELQEKFGEFCSVLKDPCCCGTKFPEDSPRTGELDFATSDIHHKLREYFGEAVGLYFQFLSHYTMWLLPVAIIGTFIFIWQLIAKTTNGHQLVIGNFIFGFIMIAWASLFLESWKRVECAVATKWGMSHFEDKETVRPEFSGEMIMSTESGEMEESEPFFKHIGRLCFSETIVLSYISLVLVIVVSLIIAKVLIINQFPDSLWGVILPPFVNALAIMICNKIYGFISIRLNNYENHRTESEFENSKISKSFMFKAVNSYNSLFVIAFFKRNLGNFNFCKQSYKQTWDKAVSIITTNCNTTVVTLPEECVFLTKLKNGLEPTAKKIPKSFFTFWQNSLPIGQPSFSANPQKLADLVGSDDYKQECGTWATWTNYSGYNSKAAVCATFEVLNDQGKGYNFRGECLWELTLQLLILFSTQIVVGNLMEVGIPYFVTNSKVKKALEENNNLSAPEMEMFFPQYEGTFADYDELVVQFGYVVLFVVVFPAAPMLALLNNALEFRVDGSKLTEMTRRPYPMGAQDIGTWYSTLSILAFVAIASNLALLFLLPSNILPDTNPTYTINWRFIVFLIFEHLLMILKFSISFCVDDKPGWVSSHLARQDFVTDVLVGR